jgi:hypothetical protein
MEVACSFEVFVGFQRITRHYIPEDRTLQTGNEETAWVQVPYLEHLLLYFGKDLLRLNRDQLRWVVRLLTGHCYLKGHLFKLGLTDGPTFERCLQEDESVTHILRDCEAI